MSKAFTDEETGDAPSLVPPRAPLPEGVPNYVSARGLELLRPELAALQAERSQRDAEAGGPERARALAVLAQRRTALEQRIASAELVAIPRDAPDTVRFGACVTLEASEGRRRYQIVGVDEADAAHGKLAFVAPLARALLGHRVGDCVSLRTPRGEEELEILAVDYDAPR